MGADGALDADGIDAQDVETYHGIAFPEDPYESSFGDDEPNDFKARLELLINRIEIVPPSDPAGTPSIAVVRANGFANVELFEQQDGAWTLQRPTDFDHLLTDIDVAWPHVAADPPLIREGPRSIYGTPGSVFDFRMGTDFGLGVTTGIMNAGVVTTADGGIFDFKLNALFPDDGNVQHDQLSADRQHGARRPPPVDPESTTPLSV